MNRAELRNTCCLMELNSMEECDSHHPVRLTGVGGWMGCGSHVLSFLIVSVDSDLLAASQVFRSLMLQSISGLILKDRNIKTVII